MLRKSIVSKNAKKASEAKKSKKAKVTQAKSVVKSVSAESSLETLLKKSEPINFRAVHDAWEYMQEVGIEEFEYRSSKFEIKLRAATGLAAPAPRGVLTAKPSHDYLPNSEQQVRPAASPASVAATVNAQARKDVHVVTCPFVGTFYRAAGPNENSYVEIGTTVKPGDVLCIVEAMKLMNEIESDASGKISKILVENGTAVEFGEPLFEIEKV